MSAAQLRKQMLRKQIFFGCRTLGLDDDDRHAMQEVATGKTSLKHMTESDLKLVVAALKKKGFGRRVAAPRADLRYIHVLWRLLGKAGKLDRPGRDGLNAFIRSRFESAWGAVPADIDMIRDHQQIEAVIRALTTWCTREGVSLER